MTYVFEFMLIMVAFSTIYYLIPVSIVFFLFKWKGNPLRTRRIQKHVSSRDDITREIISSFKAILLFSILITILAQFIKAGESAIYTSLHDRSIVYFIFSPLLAMIVHDTYYYWFHRAMHTRLLFQYTHALHHKSRTPTPWAIYSFQPLEVIFTFAIFAFIVLFIPLHPVALGLYLLISLFNNVAGHLGFEIVPPFGSPSRTARYFLTVSFHDLHHTSPRTNFGVYFIFWDRIMNTLNAKYLEVYSNAVRKNNDADHETSN